MKASTLPRFLLGSREAILEVASSRMALVCSVLFVISAGFAREYDGEDLLHEPWHLLRPLGASLVSGTVLFVLIHGVAWLRADSHPDAAERPPSLLRSYWAFMAVFWMTAPLAWLYAIPYERFLDPVDAVAVNLWTLALVSAWRVLLITRAISVLYDARPVATFFLVMLFADVVVIAAVAVAPTPIIDIMGGIRHTDRDALVANITFLVMVLSQLTLPVWLVCALIAVFVFRPHWPQVDEQSSRSRGLVMVSLASILIWAPVLPFTQPEQINRRRAERLLEGGQVAAGLAELSAHEPSEYPPHWDFPPRTGYGDATPGTDAIVAAMQAEWPAPWVAEMYLEKVDLGLRQRLAPFWGSAPWKVIVERMPDEMDPQEAAWALPQIHFLLDHPDQLSEEDVHGLRAWRARAERALGAHAAPPGG